MVWTLLQPLLYLLIYLVVFSWILQVKFTEGGESGDFALYLVAGLLPWLAFNDGVVKAAGSVVENAGLVKGVSFPAVVLVASSVLASIANLLIGFSVFLVVLLLTGHLSWSGLLFLPFLVCLQAGFAFGLGLFAASLYTFLRDLMPVLQLGFTVWFYLTPIIYPLSYVPEQLRSLVFFNPFTPLVTAYRVTLLEGAMPSGVGLLVAAAWTIMVVLLGSLIFTRVEPGFAEVL